jgi:Rad3-related DNA helicase
MLICDECSEAPEWLSRSLDFTITERECREAKEPLKPPPGDSCEEWAALGPRLAVAAEYRYNLIKARATNRGQPRESLLRDIRRAEGFLDCTSRLQNLDDNWVVTKEEGQDEGRVWRFECVWPGRYKERLFRNIPRVVLMSATLRPKTLGLLGIPRAECDFREWGRQFPAANGPVIWVPTVRVNHKISEENERAWMARIADILARRGDRRGLIHTVSYARAKRIAEAIRQELDGRVILNGAADPDSSTAREAFDRFIKGAADAVLCSPSFSTGWDFAGTAAEYQIIAKLPLPDPRSKVMQARIERDPSYPDYLGAQALVQSCGRVVRSDTDRGETIIIDDSWAWFKRKAEDHMPKWFKVRREEQLPPPLPKII